MATNDARERIIGYWRGAIRAVFICPHCSRIMTVMEIEKFKELLGQPEKPTGPQPRCSRCKELGFIYLEQPWERIWKVMERGRQLMRFHGWRKRRFLMRVDALYSKDSKALLNLRRLREMGFKSPGRSRGVKEEWAG